MAKSAEPGTVHPLVADDDPLVRSLENAPIDADAFSAEDIAHLEAIHAEPLGPAIAGGRDPRRHR
jgi:hypothetical protein